MCRSTTVKTSPIHFLLINSSVHIFTFTRNNNEPLRIAFFINTFSMAKYAWTYHRQEDEHTCSSSWVSWAFAHSRIHGPASDPSRLGSSFVVNRLREIGG
jgi:hypothetical protein